MCAQYSWNRWLEADTFMMAGCDAVCSAAPRDPTRTEAGHQPGAQEARLAAEGGAA